MPRNQKERMVFAFLTVIITVHAFVFYSLYVVNGTNLMTTTGMNSVIGAINSQGGVYMLANYLPIWIVILVESIFAFSLECLFGQPLSFKFASMNFNPKETHPVLFETAIIASTVAIMCPLMSFIANILYYPYDDGFNAFTFLANYFKLVCLNFPFAFFSQLFFIQPLIRTVFKTIYKRN